MKKSLSVLSKITGIFFNTWKRVRSSLEYLFCKVSDSPYKQNRLFYYQGTTLYICLKIPERSSSYFSQIFWAVASANTSANKILFKVDNNKITKTVSVADGLQLTVLTKSVTESVFSKAWRFYYNWQWRSLLRSLLLVKFQVFTINSIDGVCDRSAFFFRLWWSLFFCKTSVFEGSFANLVGSPF